MVPQRVLHIISSTMRAGVAAMVMNVYRHADRHKLQFDFVAHNLGDDDFGDEISRLGGKVFRVPFLSEAGMPGFVRLIRGIISDNGPYAAVHAHTDYQGGFSAMAAKQAGVPIRICHSHSDTRAIISPVFLAKKLLGRAIITRYATQRCACSLNAGLSLFGKHAMKQGRVTVIRNGIDLSGFTDYPPLVREQLRQSCGADDASRLIGYVGRLSPEKNPSFILDMAAEAQKQRLNYRFVFAGNGDLRDTLLRSRERLHLEDTVCFLGTRDDIPSLMQCFDMVVVPSFYEGLPMSALEAQAAGTPVIVTARVPREADMGLGLFHTMDLTAGAQGWLRRAGMLMTGTARPDAAERIQAIRNKGFDAAANAACIARLYGLND
jgi:glycosyltransferase EpsF